MFEVITIEDQVGQFLSKLPVEALIELANNKNKRAELEIFRRRLGALTRIRIEVARGKQRAEIVASIKAG